MARPNPIKFPHHPSPKIDEDGDVLVSSASSTSAEFDPEFDTSPLSPPGAKSPKVSSKSSTTPSTSHPLETSINTHTTPTLRASQSKPKFLAEPESTSPPRALDHRQVPFPVDRALKDALVEGKPVLTAIFGEAVVRALNGLERCIPGDLLVSDGEFRIKTTVWIAASTGLSNPDHSALEDAAKLVADRDQWDRIISEGKEKLDPRKYEATVLGNANTSCKMVFRLLQML